MTKSFYRTALCTSSALVAAAAFSTSAFAQIAPQEQVQEGEGTLDQSAPMVEQTASEVITITGSRIQNPNLEQASPVAVVTSDEIELRQSNTVETFLREIPGVVPSIGSQVNNGNGGNTFVNLRGIGANRHITLLNGNRVVPASLAGITNLDVIPVALLERTDVLTGGAGSTYGADAISGVINFITKQDFEGVELSLTEAITEEGDGSTFRGDLTLGANFDDGRGNAVVSIGYTNRDAVFQGDRPFGFENISSISGNPGGSGTTIPTNFFGLSGIFDGTGTLQVSPDGEELQPFYQPFNFNP
ncbi:MAG: TonB-dependent receptor plug domain-containing protein, partial [Pacificimonas sp.]